MINKSIRFFSVEEIKGYIKDNNYPNDFIEYTKVAPASIKSILGNMGVVSSILDIAQACNNEPTQKNESGLLIDTTDAPQIEKEHPHKQAEDPTFYKAIPVESDKAEQIVTKCSEGELNKEEHPTEAEGPNDADLYSSMKFGERISVNRLVLHETMGSVCKEHGIDYQTIRVVMRTNNHEFAVRTKCCPKCKKLYMKASYFQGMKGLLDKKRINYTWIPIKG